MATASEGPTEPHPRTPEPHQPSGGLLSGARLLRMLETEDKIFRSGSWDSAQIKGAGYELRLANDFLVHPDKPGSSTFKTFRPTGGDARTTTGFTLAPGDSAMISTEERFSLDFDISAMIGPKFRWSAKGLLVLHGSVAHPGYGREMKKGGWRVRDDERLYFVVANIGPGPILLKPGDPIAYIQFFEVEYVHPQKTIDNGGFDELITSLFEPDPSNRDGGLSYFKNVRDLQTDVTALREEVKESRAQVDGRLDVLGALVERTRSSAETVVVFGVFLVAVTILGVVLNSVVSAVNAIPPNATDFQISSVRWMTIAFGFLALGGVTAVIFAISRAMKPQGRENVRHDGSVRNQSSK